jgi:hypothetical protein
VSLGDTPILDTFTGADQNPIAGNWTASMPSGSALPGLRRVSNQLAAPAGAAVAASEYTTAFGADCEVYATLAALGTPDTATAYIFARKAVAGGPDANFDNYMVKFFNSAGAGIDGLWLVRDDDGSDTNLTTQYLFEAAVGDVIGLRCIGTTITGWFRQGAVTTTFGSVTDATYSAGGYLGAVLFDDGVRFDDFGGGTVVTAEKQSSYYSRRRSTR